MALVQPPRSAHRDPRPFALAQARARRCGSRGAGPTCARCRARCPALARSRPAAARLARSPRSVRSTSTQPVNRFSRFHVLWPWRSSTSVYGKVDSSRSRIRRRAVARPARRSVPRMPDLHVVTLCTGNAARSVMAGAILREHVPGLAVTTSGTHVIEGMPMSWRTRDAIASLDIPVPDHRSRQATVAELDHADLVIALAREHVVVDAARAPAGRARTPRRSSGSRATCPPVRARCGTRLAPMQLARGRARAVGRRRRSGRRRPRRVRRVRARDRRPPPRPHPASVAVAALAADAARSRALVAPAHTALVLQEVQNGVVGTPSVLPALAEPRPPRSTSSRTARSSRTRRAGGRRARRALHRRDARRRQGREPQRPAVPRREARAGEAVARERRGAGARRDRRRPGRHRAGPLPRPRPDDRHAARSDPAQPRRHARSSASACRSTSG